jgi:hypothetical protein
VALSVLKAASGTLKIKDSIGCGTGTGRLAQVVCEYLGSLQGPGTASPNGPCRTPQQIASFKLYLLEVYSEASEGIVCQRGIFMAVMHPR